MIRYFKRHAWLFALIAFLLLFPQALSSQARLNNRVLITGLALDKVENGYEITAQVVMPTSGSESGGEGANLNFITETGASLVEGIKKISYNIGEIAGLSHTNFIILGESLFDDNIIADLDYLIRDATLPNSMMLLFCEGSAKDQMTKTGDLEISVGLGLQKVYLYKQESLNSRMVALQEFIDFAYEPARVSVLPKINITKEGEDDSGGNQDSSDGSSTSSSQSSSGGATSGTSSSAPKSSDTKQGRIEYFTPLAYFKDGFYVDTISEQNQIIAYLLTQNNSNRFDIVINNVTGGEIYHNAEVGLRVGKKTCDIETDFSGAKPKLKITIGLDKIKLMEVRNEGVAYEGTYASLQPYLNETLNSAIRNQIKENITSIFEKTKAQNVDIFRAADNAYKFNKDEWQEYLKSVKDISNYIADFEIEVVVDLKTFI